VVDELLASPISVTEAIARRDANLDDTELAIQGFVWTSPVMLDCAIDEVGPQLLTRCEIALTWLALTDETRPGLGPVPVAAGFNLALQPETIGEITASPTEVIVLGHFDDHRAALCRPERVDSCRKQFVVDAVVDATTRHMGGRITVDEHAAILTTIDDAILFAGLELRDPAIIAVFAVPNRALSSFEPAGAGAPELTGNAVWIVRWVDDTSGRPVVRTRLVAEDEPDHRGIGSFEVDAGGLHPVPPAPALTDPGDPLSAAPTTILGLSVMDIETVLDRKVQLSNTEVAVRGWYMPPDPRATCDGRDAIIHSIELPCDAGRHWLLERPEQLWAGPGQDDPQPLGLFLNPTLPADVRFDLPDPWADGSPEPVPVVLIGHFNDPRSQTRSGTDALVVDALVWHPGATTNGTGTLVRLTNDSTEDPAAVLGRIDAEIGAAPVTWATVVRATDFPILDSYLSERRPELMDGRALWIVRRLVPDLHARDRLVVDTAYVVDGGDHVWLKPANADPELETSIDVGPFGDHTRLVEVLDYDHWIVSVRRATAADQLTWQKSNPKRDGIVEVARGATDRDVGIRWNGGACALDWQLLVDGHPSGADPSLWIQPYTFGNLCTNPGAKVTRALVITFNRPIDLDIVRSSDGRCCG
jgi:hypothetical protein